MDGVLVDNMPIHFKAFTELARRHGVTGVNYDSVMALNGRGSGEFFNALLPSELVERIGVTDLNIEKEAIYREMYAPLLAPAPGLIAFLNGLRSHGVRLAVGTSAIVANLDFVLDGLGIRHYFDVLVTCDMVTRTKPDPEIYLRALEGLGLPANECLVFEDAVAGIQAARAAGIRSIALSTTEDSATLEATPGVALTVPDFTSLNFAMLDALL